MRFVDIIVPGLKEAQQGLCGIPLMNVLQALHNIFYQSFVFSEATSR